MDRWVREILERFQSRAEEIAEEIASSTVNEVPGFTQVKGRLVHVEIRDLARRHLDAFLVSARSGLPPDPDVIVAARERAASRAREIVPLAALLHSYLIAQRVITAALASAATSHAAMSTAA
jgi:hypothetical protein